MAGIYTQKRNIPSSGFNPYWEMSSKATGAIVTKGDYSYVCDQVTTSFRTGKGESLVTASELRDTNQYLNSLLSTKAVEYDTGHAFSTVKRTLKRNVPMFFYKNPYGSVLYNMYGPVTHTSLLSIIANDYPVIPIWASANSDGNKAISMTYPTKPEVSLAQTIVELKREGLPSLFGSQIASMKGSAARAIGGEFLNSVFGWTPLISDLDKLLKSVVSSSKTIQQMKRDSGKQVRRKYHFPEVREVVKSTIVKGVANHRVNSAAPSITGTLITEEIRTTKTYFSGAYTYFLDPGKDLVGKAIMYEQLANKLLGLRITPATLWELAPWSWLADWYANIGENLTVASAFQSDGLVLKYGYVMRKVIATKMYTYTPDPQFLAAGYPVSHAVLTTTSKERIKSSPYGFGLNTGDFNDRQWAILGALGLTKAPRSLR
jgi:hypothetical protein